MCLYMQSFPRATRKDALKFELSELKARRIGAGRTRRRRGAGGVQAGAVWERLATHPLRLP